MKALKNILILTLLFISHTASAGWYECYNFKGKIGDYPITLSFQYYDWSYKEPEKKEFNLKGYYRYDKYNTPIPIEGKWDKLTNTLVFYELDAEGRQQARLSAVSNSDGQLYEGHWEKLDTQKRLNFHLDFESVLIDRSGAMFDHIEVLQSVNLPDYYMVGIYKKEDGSYRRAFMTALNIIRKKDNTLFQTFTFDDYFYDIGNVKTLIYDNVEQFANEKGGNDFVIWCDAGKMGGYYEVCFDRQKNRFVIAPEPFIEGVGKPDSIPEKD